VLWLLVVTIRKWSVDPFTNPNPTPSTVIPTPDSIKETMFRTSAERHAVFPTEFLVFLIYSRRIMTNSEIVPQIRPPSLFFTIH
jgi:hypothetical protein